MIERTNKLIRTRVLVVDELLSSSRSVRGTGGSLPGR